MIDEVLSDRQSRLSFKLTDEFGINVTAAVALIRSIDVIESNGRTTDDLRKLIIEFNDVTSQIRESDPIFRLGMLASKRVGKKCDECGSSMYLTEITKPEGNSNKFGYTMFDTCTKCSHQEFKSGPFAKEARKRKLALREEVERLMFKEHESKRRHFIIPSAIKCSECGKSMTLYKIDGVAGTNDNVFGYRSVLTCLGCGSQKFHKKEYSKVRKRLDADIKKELGSLVLDGDGNNITRKIQKAKIKSTVKRIAKG